MHHRNTPKGNLCSLSQLLMSKSIRTKLPVTIDYLKPKITKLSDHQNKIKIKTDKMANYYNKNTKTLKPLTAGEKVLFKVVPNGPWINGKINQIGKYPRSYIVQGEKGGIYRRNRKHLIASSLTISKTNNYELDTQPNLNLNIDKKCTRSGRMIVKPKRLDL